MEEEGGWEGERESGQGCWASWSRTVWVGKKRGTVKCDGFSGGWVRRILSGGVCVYVGPILAVEVDIVQLKYAGRK